MKLRFVTLLLLGMAAGGNAQPFHLPTANRAIFQPGSEAKYFVGTTGKPWTSGTFGPVRSQGAKLHEGIDIKCQQRDKGGEPIDPVLATADGAVVYVNLRPSLSTFGNYLVLRHVVEGLEIYSVYAHLRSVREDIKVGRSVKAGETIATMGRTAGTREGISRDRAHLHFELNLLMNDNFAAWFKLNNPGQRNDHGAWNGQNLYGLDPRLVFLAQQREGTNFSLLKFVRKQTELCRVLVRKAQFPYVKRYAPLIRPNPVANKEGITGYELALDYVGVIFEIIPRAASEIKNQNQFQLLSVNENEQRHRGCRHFLLKSGKTWKLSNNGLRFLELLCF